jgi:hypothetical protein
VAGFPGLIVLGLSATSFTYVTAGMQKIVGGRAGDFRLNRGQKFRNEHPGKRRYLPAKDSAALAAKALYLLGLDSITFISCQS